ncbi:MAG: hypothetical protein UHO61_05925 [Acutalibacteraceae bacterium]|nr:hypothetical protein [Acutalibacteraceae bacterium]
MIYIKVSENGTLHTFDCTVSDSVRYETVKFDFPKSWEDYTKTAVFRNGEKILSVILNSGGELCLGADECYIPYEVIKFPEFTVSVFGISGDSRTTTPPAVIKVIQSGYGEGDEPFAPTPGEYEQLVNLANETREIARSVRADADNGAFNGENGYTPVLGVDYVTIDQNTEYVFDGGDADQSVPTVIMVDDEFSEYSSNAIMNKTVTEKLSAIDSSLEDMADSIWERIYPVGSIYISALSTSPASLFGGTWEQIKDTFLLASGDSYTAGATGGEEKHTLTEAELPHLEGAIFNFALQNKGATVGTSGVFKSRIASMWVGYATEGENSDGSVSDYIDFSFGDNQPHNNMPPYLAVYVWKRTA